MGWPSGFTTRTAVFANVNQKSGTLKSHCADLRARSAAGDITSAAVTGDLLDRLINAKGLFSSAAATPGIAEHVSTELTAHGEPKTPAQVAALFADMSGAVDNAILWIESNYPTSASGAWEERIPRKDGTGLTDPLTFSPAQTAGLRATLQAIEDAIDD